MPILPPEASLFPEDLFADKPSPATPHRCWWVLHTKPRQEKSIARHLHRYGVPFYLPLMTRHCWAGSRSVATHIPLFPGYVFLWGDGDERLIGLTSGRVVRALDVPCQHELWSDLRQLRQLLESRCPVTPEHGVVTGDSVEIMSGPLAGLRGKVLRTASGFRFVVQVNFIQRGASVMLDGCRLLKVPDDDFNPAEAQRPGNLRIGVAKPAKTLGAPVARRRLGGLSS